MALVVTLNKICKLRASRGADKPDLDACISQLAAAGCSHLLLHRWPDERHVTTEDLRRVDQHPDIRSGRVAFRVGGFVDEESLQIASSLRSVDAFVATPFDAAHRTTQRGWAASDPLAPLIQAKRTLGSEKRLILFVEPSPDAPALALQIGADALELNCRTLVGATGRHEQSSCMAMVEQTLALARQASLPCGLAHDIDSDWAERLAPLQPDWITVGHSFVADSVVAGLKQTFQHYADGARGERASVDPLTSLGAPTTLWRP